MSRVAMLHNGNPGRMCEDHILMFTTFEIGQETLQFTMTATVAGPFWVSLWADEVPIIYLPIDGGHHRLVSGDALHITLPRIWRVDADDFNITAAFYRAADNPPHENQPVVVPEPARPRGRVIEI
jgi:hypothetical protein